MINWNHHTAPRYKQPPPNGAPTQNCTSVSAECRTIVCNIRLESWVQNPSQVVTLDVWITAVRNKANLAFHVFYSPLITDKCLVGTFVRIYYCFCFTRFTGPERGTWWHIYSDKWLNLNKWSHFGRLYMPVGLYNNRTVFSDFIMDDWVCIELRYYSWIRRLLTKLSARARSYMKTASRALRRMWNLSGRPLKTAMVIQDSSRMTPIYSREVDRCLIRLVKVRLFSESNIVDL